MPSEKLASAENALKGNLASAWNILEGSSGDYTDLGIGRRFGGAAAAYSLRDIGAMNGSVVRVRREPNDTTAGIDDEERFSANQVQDGTLERWVNGELESTLPADVDTAAAAYSLRRVSEGAIVYTADFSADTDDIGKNISNQDDVTLTGNVDGISDGSTSKDNVLKVENNATITPQLKNLDTEYRDATDGIVEFTYYVPTGHPIIGNYWHIGTADGGATPPEVIYSGEGEKIVGGAWTTATIKFGRRYSPFGVDKPDDKSFRFLTILDQKVSDKILENPVTANDGDIYYISDITVKHIRDAVRIRRSSDNVEVDVAFDSDDKVSASSAITNVAEQGGESGSTNATDLNGFLNANEQTVGSAANGTGSVDFNSFSGNSNTGFTVTNSDAGTFKQAVFPYGSGEGDVIVANFDLNVTSGSPTIQVRTGAAIGTVTAKSNDATVSSSTNHTITLTCTGDGLYIKFLESDACTFTVSNFSIVSHTQGATVHTWYDQAGSNNAVQTTSANQPKIAENGALLADGLKFDGTDDMLTNSNVGAMQASDGMSSFTVHKKRIASTSTTFGDDNPQYLYHLCDTSLTDTVLAHRILGGELSILRANAAADGFLITRTTNHLIETTKNLSSAIGSSGFQNHYNATTPAEDVENTGTSFDSTTTEFTIGAQDGIGGGGRFYDGKIEELIIYTSDQSNNRFKIESNINNYYGLYNDANEVTGDFTSSGAESFTANGTDGFTLTNSTSTAFGGIELNQVLAAGEKIYVSFNFSIDAGANTSPNLNIREGSITGTTASNEGFFTPSEGFNSTVFTSDSGGDARYISFGENDADPSTYTISDFKVSRIARNGFVETLYDQSGNGDDMTQATAGSQPAIVQNGGQVRLENGKPAFKGDGTDDHLEASYFYSAGEVTAMSTFSVVSNRSDTGDESTIISAGSGVSTTYSGFVTSLDKNANANPFEQRVANASGKQETSVLDISRDGDILGSTFFTKDGTHLVKATTEDGTTSTSAAITVGAYRGSTVSGKLRIGATRTFALQRFFNFPIAETMVFRADLRDEGIEDEINQFYNIG